MIYGILSETVESYPEKLALVCSNERFSYTQLKERVDKLACGFKSIGIDRNDKIAVIHKNCHRFLEAYFAASKIGAILVPVNYRLAKKDFTYILNNSEAKALIAQPCFLSSILEIKDDLSLLENIILTGPFEDKTVGASFLDYESFLENTPLKREDIPLNSEDDIAQIYYTSGTTGKPKGVILTHENLLVHTDGTIKELGLSSSDRWLHVSPMFHLADAWAVWSITKVAATHVIIPCFDPKDVLKTISERGVTLSNFIPTMLNILVNFEGLKSYDVSSLRVILSGGAPIAKEVVRKIVKIFGCDYIQTYGLTETSPFLTMSILEDEMKSLPFEERLKYMATTGRPFYNVQLKLVKEDGTEVNPNDEDVGEIVVKGDTITPGYWRLPDETAKRIVDNWLHTRDLAVINPEGYVTIVDRMDDMIITGGENVYSVEVEDVLYSHPCILEAAVIGLPDYMWGEKVTAVVVLKENEEVGDEEVIEYCKDNLAHFKAPKNVIFTKQLPKTGSAKICKYKLREMYGKKTK
ncbi:MAG: long-chain-fatty-acid--CoA ligase [Candidatus Aminicenantes bacterium]|nr:MAG: long-chain-fatty-acid--CoA ligase [Candidatus Aminicenantes bacterium]